MNFLWFRSTNWQSPLETCDQKKTFLALNSIYFWSIYKYKNSNFKAFFLKVWEINKVLLFKVCFSSWGKGWKSNVSTPMSLFLKLLNPIYLFICEGAFDCIFLHLSAQLKYLRNKFHFCFDFHSYTFYAIVFLNWFHFFKIFSHIKIVE